MAQDHCAGRDVLLLGDPGCGKSELSRSFAQELGYNLSLFSLYKDMTARDLLQRRATDKNGDTTWERSPLVEAALKGDLLVLDGVDGLDPDTITIVQRLIMDREVQLFDGTRLVREVSVYKFPRACTYGCGVDVHVHVCICARIQVYLYIPRHV